MSFFFDIFRVQLHRRTSSFAVAVSRVGIEQRYDAQGEHGARYLLLLPHSDSWALCSFRALKGVGFPVRFPPSMLVGSGLMGASRMLGAVSSLRPLVQRCVAGLVFYSSLCGHCRYRFVILALTQRRLAYLRVHGTAAVIGGGLEL